MVDYPALVLISVIMLLIGAALGFALSMLRSNSSQDRPDSRPGRAAGSQHTGKETAPPPAVHSLREAEADLRPTPTVDSTSTMSVDPNRANRFSPLDVFARALISEAPRPQPLQSLAAQIDAILQEKLEGSPLSTRGIRLQEHPQQGLIVQVGLNRYESVDDVPENEIRDFIREAIAEWENR